MLKARWERLIGAPSVNQSGMLKETRDRRTGTAIVRCPGLLLIPARSVRRKASVPRRQIGYPGVRPAVPDTGQPGSSTSRGRSLWQVASDRQVFAIEQHDEPLTAGPGLVFASDVPDIHFFRGRGGRVCRSTGTRQAWRRTSRPAC